MAKKNVKKPRSEKYDPKVTFDGSFEDMIKISTTGAGAKKKGETKPETTNNVKPKKKQ